jgi:hypothetical protein
MCFGCLGNDCVFLLRKAQAALKNENSTTQPNPSAQDTLRMVNNSFSLSLSLSLSLSVKSEEQGKQRMLDGRANCSKLIATPATTKTISLFVMLSLYLFLSLSL